MTVIGPYKKRLISARGNESSSFLPDLLFYLEATAFDFDPLAETGL